MAGVPFSKPRSQKRERSFLASTVHTASGGEPPGPGRAPPCSVFLGGSSCRPQAEWQTTAHTCRPTPAAPRENIVAATQRSDRRAGLTLSTRGACGQRRSKGDEHADRAVLLGSRLVSTAEGARAVSGLHLQGLCVASAVGTQMAPRREASSIGRLLSEASSGTTVPLVCSPSRCLRQHLRPRVEQGTEQTRPIQRRPSPLYASLFLERGNQSPEADPEEKAL